MKTIMIHIAFLAIAVVLALVPRGLARELFWNDVNGIHRLFPGNPTASRLFQTFETRGIVVDIANDQLLWSDIVASVE